MRPAQFALLVLVAFSAMTCGRQGPITIGIDPSSKPDEITITENAIRRWNELPTNDDHTLVRSKLWYDADWRIKFTEDPIIVKGGSENGNTCTSYSASVNHCPDPYQVLVLRNQYGGQDKEMTVIHEFGHVLGLKHVPDPNAVMVGGQIITATDFTDKDFDECVRVDACPSIVGRPVK